MKKTFLLCLFALLLLLEGHACTMVLVSGSATADGRPLMCKNRDSAEGYNVDMRIVRGEGYTYLAQFHYAEGNRVGPWGGFNEKGFAISNTLTYNVTAAGTDGNSLTIEKALLSCETVDDFKEMLDSMLNVAPLKVKANFGVLDAHGDAAFFEVWATGYQKYDVNDPEIAPDGVLVRTNYSLSGSTSNRVGEDRYTIASNYMNGLSEGVNWRDLLQLSRLLVNKKGTNLCNQAPQTFQNEKALTLDGYIPRNVSTNAMLIQGVKEDESPLLTVCWSMVGTPITTVAVPTFLTSDDELPSKVLADGGKAWLCDRGRVLREFVFAYPQSAKKIDLAKLYNKEGTGIMQIVKGIEEEVLDRGEALIAEAREAGELTPSAWHAYCEWLDPYLEGAYDSAFAFLWKRGDVNQDNHVDVTDVSVLVNILLRKSNPTSSSDVNGDKGINVTDVSNLVNIILGLE